MIKFKITTEHTLIVYKMHRFKQQTNRSLLNIRKSLRYDLWQSLGMH